MQETRVVIVSFFLAYGWREQHVWLDCTDRFVYVWPMPEMGECSLQNSFYLSWLLRHFSRHVQIWPPSRRRPIGFLSCSMLRHTTAKTMQHAAQHYIRWQCERNLRPQRDLHQQSRVSLSASAAPVASHHHCFALIAPPAKIFNNLKWLLDVSCIAAYVNTQTRTENGDVCSIIVASQPLSPNCIVHYSVDCTVCVKYFSGCTFYDKVKMCTNNWRIIWVLWCFLKWIQMTFISYVMQPCG